MEKEESPKTEAQEKKDESQIVSVSLFILQCAHSLTTSQQVNDSPRQLDHHGSLIPIHTSLAFSRIRSHVSAIFAADLSRLARKAHVGSLKLRRGRNQVLTVCWNGCHTRESVNVFSLIEIIMECFICLALEGCLHFSNTGACLISCTFGI